MGFLGKGNTNGNIQIMCEETGFVFESAIAAAKFTGCSGSNISNVLQGKRKKAGGFHWKYV